MSQAAPAAVRCERLERVYDGGYHALRGISFSVGNGEFAAIMGPSGCGKSTLLNILGLLDRATRGHYHIRGVDASHLTDADMTALRRKTIGFVFQAFNLLPRLTALENVCLPMAYDGVGLEEREERGRILLKQVGLSHKTHHTPLQLSGGERQRVGIARALSNRPALLLADEPTGNLDSKSSAEILQLFKDLHAQGMTILLVTHDPNIGAAAQRTIRLRDGVVE